MSIPSHLMALPYLPSTHIGISQRNVREMRLLRGVETCWSMYLSIWTTPPTLERGFVRSSLSGNVNTGDREEHSISR